MPNGGSDCCGTCWFNTVNSGQPGYPANDKMDSIVCEIRNFTPEVPFWTYCDNHPHHNPGKIRVPIGPVYVCKEDSYSRIEKTKPLDTEEIRLELVKLIEKIPEVPDEEYPSQTSFNIEVIKHVGFIRESRAQSALLRILKFDPFAEPEDNKFNQNNVLVISNALEALAAVSPETSFEHIEPWVSFGLPIQSVDEYTPENDRCAPIRYHAVRALKNVEAEGVDEVLENACSDPHPEIQAFAKEILKLRGKNT